MYESCERRLYLQPTSMSGRMAQLPVRLSVWAAAALSRCALPDGFLSALEFQSPSGNCSRAVGSGKASLCVPVPPGLSGGASHARASSRLPLKGKSGTREMQVGRHLWTHAGEEMSKWTAAL